MEESASQIFLQLTTGALGGIAVALLLENFSLGKAINPIVGAAGGALGCGVLVTLGWAGNHFITDYGSSTLGGAALVLIMGIMKSRLISQ